MKASPSLSKSLIDNPNWSEVSALIRLTLIAGYQAKQLLHNQLYVPEIIHVVTLVAGFGSTIVRKSVYGIVMNLLQSLYLARTEDSPASELQQLITDYTQTDTLKLFGLLRTTPTSEYTSFEPPNDSVNIDYQERLVDLLARMLEVTAGTRGALSSAFCFLSFHTYHWDIQVYSTSGVLVGWVSLPPPHSNTRQSSKCGLSPL